MMNQVLDDRERLKPHLQRVKRLVVKVGTAVLGHPKTGINEDVVRHLTADIARLMERGIEVILVSSGAVGMGMSALGAVQYPRDLCDRQAYAALGQGLLMACYRGHFAPHGYKVAQLLLTRRDIEERTSYLNARNAIRKLLDLRVIPIVNENDTTATEELSTFGDNDYLAALVAGKMDAQALVILTTVDGLYRNWSKEKSEGELVRIVEENDEETFAHAGGPESGISLGGMASKIAAGRMVSSFGTLVAIANGRRPGILLEIMEGRGLGTHILPCGSRLSGRKHWIAYGKRASGVVIVDRGARRALQEHGKSLLPKGVIGVAGNFKRSDLVEVHDEDGAEFARGLVNFSAKELEQLAGHPASDAEKLFGPDRAEEAIHRDNLVILT